MNRPFEIQTLSDRNYGFKNYSRLGDPVTVITGIATILPSLFPNLFGSERLTQQHLNTLFPSNGVYTSQFKNFLLQKVKYAKDLERDLYMYSEEFVKLNQSFFCPSGAWVTGQGRATCMPVFYEVLRKEAATGGQSPVGNIYGAGINYETLLLIGGGVLLLSVLLKKKSRKK